MRFPILLPRVRTIAWALCFSVLSTPSSALAVFTEQGATWLGGANYSGRSASLADIDGDGDLDLYFQGSTSFTPHAQQLFRNNTINAGGVSSNTFTNVTATMLPTGLTDSWSAAWGDYDGDGKVDVFVGQTNSGSVTGMLLHNTGTAFTNVSTATGLNDPGFAQNVAWGDFNGDHMLDLIIGMEGPEKNQIYLQGPAGHFTPVGASVGIQSPVGTKSYGMAVGDYDGDGDPDIYISTCTGTGSGTINNAFYKNMLKETGTLSFVEVSSTNGTQKAAGAQSYGAQFVDFDNDGKLDLWVVGSDGFPTKIYKNMGDGTFKDVDTITGHPLLSDQGTDLNGGAAIDYDNDGKLDLYFHDNLSSTSNVKLYHNDGNWQFTDVTTAQGITGTGAGGYDGVWGDIDRDGDQDLINPNTSSVAERVYINDASTNGNHWLYVKLKGPSWDTTGLGSSLYATLNAGTPDQVTLRREANTNAGTFNQSDLPVHFGLGTAFFINRLLIRWSDGTAQVLLNILADQYLTVTYFPGDYNGDNVVDNGDYIAWRKGLGTDFTMDDYFVWRSHFGAKLIAGDGALGGGAIPEPTTLVLLATAIPVLFYRPRR